MQPLMRFTIREPRSLHALEECPEGERAAGGKTNHHGAPAGPKPAIDSQRNTAEYEAERDKPQAQGGAKAPD